MSNNRILICTRDADTNHINTDEYEHIIYMINERIPMEKVIRNITLNMKVAVVYDGVKFTYYGDQYNV